MRRIDDSRPPAPTLFNLGLRALLVLSAAALLGCGILDEGGTPGSARVFIEGGGGATLSVVTSNDFLVVSDDGGQTTEVSLNTRDSTTVTPPLDQRYSLGSAVRFYLRVGSEGSLTIPITVRVLVGGVERLNASTDLSAQDLEFVYRSQ
jgi:hypothetical protein